LIACSGEIAPSTAACISAIGVLHHICEFGTVADQVTQLTDLK